MEINQDKLHTCINGEQGTQLIHKMADRTLAIRKQTPTFYVPWLMINNEHHDEARAVLMGFLCKNYLKSVCCDICIIFT